VARLESRRLGSDVRRAQAVEAKQETWREETPRWHAKQCKECEERRGQLSQGRQATEAGGHSAERQGRGGRPDRRESQSM
jgi:hypothetical protein